jgi:hypothetical protein
MSDPAVTAKGTKTVIIPGFFGKIGGTKEDAGAVLVTPSGVASSVRSTGMRAKSIPPLTPAQDERFWSKVDVPEQPSCCWEWIGNIHATGYGQFSLGQRQLLPHRVAYTLLIGPIPLDRQLDHLCRNRRCVNPDHLQVATPRINTLRSGAIPAINARKTHCIQGHEYTPDNTKWNGNKRSCRLCRVEGYRRYRANKRARKMAEAA